MMRARYLDEHRPMERDRMLLDGTLAQHLADIDREVLLAPQLSEFF